MKFFIFWFWECHSTTFLLWIGRICSWEVYRKTISTVGHLKFQSCKSRSNISTRLGASCARVFSCFNFLFVPAVWFWGLEFQLLCESPSFHSVTCQCTSSVDFHCSVLFFCPSLWHNHFQSLKPFLQPVSPFLPQDFHDLLSSNRFLFLLFQVWTELHADQLPTSQPRSFYFSK